MSAVCRDNVSMSENTETAAGREPVRLGLVGTGAVMGQHLRGFGATGRARIVGVVSAHPDRAESITRDHGGAAFSSVERMLDEARPDAVIVGVPPFRNPGICRVLVARHVPFLTEKPLAATDDAAVDELAAAVTANGLVTAVGYQLRAVEFIPHLRDLLAERPPSLVVARWLGGTPPPAWWSRIDEGGGQIVEQHTHHFDIARHLLGDAEVLGAAVGDRSMSLAAGADVPGVGSALLRFATGALGVFTSANVVPSGGAVEVQFIGGGREVTIGWSGWPLVRYDLRVVDEKGTRTSVAAIDAWQRQADAFLDAVVERDPRRPFSTYPDAAETYRLTRRVMAVAGGAN
jgi:predicted dehydrogenase